MYNLLYMFLKQRFFFIRLFLFFILLQGFLTPTLSMDCHCHDSLAVAGQSQVNDSVSPADTSLFYFRPKALIAPVSLIAVGSLGAGTGWFHRKVNVPVRDGFHRWRGTSRFHADDYLQYVPLAAYWGLSLCGVPDQTTYTERLAVLATSSLIMASIVNLTKYTVRKERPDRSARNSFMSGHTATAFMGAELVRLEYAHVSPWYGASAYLIAGSIAFLRIYNNRHWFGDVVCGAGVGILSARLGYWLLPLERKWFNGIRNKKKRTEILALPYYQLDNKAFGGTLVYNL